MKLSLRWLARHVDLSGLSAQQIAQDLTLSTCEVESVAPFAPCLSDVTVGHVLERAKHPDADKLSVCKVDVGQGEPLSIVCGAPNVRAGLKVAVATVGTSLPGDFKIKKSKIRGVDSNGMICSERELGLGDEHSGIWELPEEAALGEPVAAALGLDDFVIEIDNKSITHRPDLWGQRGFAQELAAIYARPLKPLDASLPDQGNAAPFPVRIESKACARFQALCLEGVRNQKSPLWMRSLLLAVGQRPIDLLVDVSNFVMLDLGQPNHLFDRRRLSSEGIVVRDARADERLTTLDGVERRLETRDLLICSGEKPVGLAGVMGGEATKVAADTTSLVLEVASFDAATIRRTAARLALRTDASARFEKKLSPTIVQEAAAHLVRTLQSIQPGVRLSAPPTDVGSWIDPARTLALRPERANVALGTQLSVAEQQAIFSRLGLNPVLAAGRIQVHVPSVRATKDLTCEQDLIEELGRIHRFGNIAPQPLVGELTPPQPNRARSLVRRLEDRLALAGGFRQTISYSFVSDELLDGLGMGDLDHVTVHNPIAQGLNRIRRSVLPSLLGLLPTNRRQRDQVRLFEIGKGYVPLRGQERPQEVHELALVWARPPRSGLRFDQGLLMQLQALVVDLMPALGLRDLWWMRPASPSGAEALQQLMPPFAHAVRAMEAWAVGESTGQPNPGQVVAQVAELDPLVRRKLGLSGELESEVAFAVVSIDALTEAPAQATRYKPLSSYPGLKLDVALALPEEVPADRAIKSIQAAAKGQLADAPELFDVYQGPHIAAGMRSLAFHVLLEDSSRTLEDKDRHKFLERLSREAHDLGGELRADAC